MAPGLKLEDNNSIHVSHTGGKNQLTWAIIIAVSLVCISRKMMLAVGSRYEIQTL